MQDVDRVAGSDGTMGGLAAACGAILLWCFSGVCYASGARAIGAMPYLSTTCVVGVLTIVILRLLRKQSLLQLLQVPGRVALAGFFGVAVYSVMLLEALGRAQTEELGQVILLNYLWPIWIVLLGTVMLPGRIRAGLVITGALLGFAGVVLARGVTGLMQRPASWWPHLLALTGAFLWALYCVLLRRWRIPPERGGSTFHFVVCAALAGGIALFRHQWTSLATLDAGALFWILFGGIGPVGLAYYWWEIGIKRAPVHLVAVLAYFIPIGSALLIGVFFQAAMGPWLIVGAAMIAGGAFLGHLGARRPLTKPGPGGRAA